MMARQIDADTLRAWLDAGRPVTVLDIRADADRADWFIPGSLHVNAYDALKSGQAGALADLVVPADRPVVTVCNAGRTSQIAADMLAQQGYDAMSLTGGMKAWSLAWNAAEVRLADSGTRVVQVRRTGKGCLSYVIASAGDAAVIDPSVAADVYLQIARRRGWSVRYVLETHVHADHLSRAVELARLTGAILLMPPQDRVTFPFTPIADGESIRLGGATLTALHTPGHTPESTSYVLDDVAVFTGDTVFTDSVGRPDLHADLEGARARARSLFGSLRRLAQLSPDLVVLPAHAGEPVAFDGRPVAARLGDIEAWLAGWLASESRFVERITSNLPPAPANTAEIVALNVAGASPAGDPTELEAGGNRCAVK
jgi:glyoxylase-like metal-dependent hydrolase (beta-lactamase superfamily II)